MKEAVAALLTQARQHTPVSEVVCSGMITSNVGLLEVPHLLAPAGLRELGRGVQRADFEEFAAPCYFIPGVLTRPEPLDWNTLHLADVLRGEEVEVLGLREVLSLGAASVLHLGSHPKRIELDAAGRLTGSRTVLSGELAAAVAEQTVLSGSVLPPQDWSEISDVYWQRGLDAARAHGVGRALFMIRLGHLLLRASPGDLSAYLLGLVSALTLDLLTPAQRWPLVLYGPPQLARLLANEARALGWPDVQIADPALTLRATLLGAQRILAAHLEQRYG
ncbi:2-dehydro-3-deoxygalactonokinase [Deinococcus sp. KNUC1210]|uniref:2-dehydro-3-deoxygalactonokinase n=1 Tax=Deinococcus sp. KNUC1210 TaxID=2917691 RepID=UPI002102E2F4|nr:2-dehydro-3-deoxygalactonokinase [Deinococcus sp. KNUC1210]